MTVNTELVRRRFRRFRRFVLFGLIAPLSILYGWVLPASMYSVFSRRACSSCHEEQLAFEGVPLASQAHDSDGEVPCRYSDFVARQQRNRRWIAASRLPYRLVKRWIRWLRYRGGRRPYRKPSLMTIDYLPGWLAVSLSPVIYALFVRRIR